MPEVWIATFFCLNMADPTCARLEGAVGNMSFDHSEMCELLGQWGAKYFREKLRIPLAYRCDLVGDVYVAMPRPKRLR
jgi:hypothetical protein